MEKDHFCSFEYDPWLLPVFWFFFFLQKVFDYICETPNKKPAFPFLQCSKSKKAYLIDILSPQKLTKGVKVWKVWNLKIGHQDFDNFSKARLFRFWSLYSTLQKLQHCPLFICRYFQFNLCRQRISMQISLQPLHHQEMHSLWQGLWQGCRLSRWFRWTSALRSQRMCPCSRQWM